jgi:hypothetical protein
MIDERAARRPILAVGTGRCGSTLFSAMMRLHPRILSVSEWFTVLGERRAIEGGRTTGDAFWKFLTVPSLDVIEFFGRDLRTPEVLVSEEWRSRAGAESIPPIALIPLTHLGGDVRRIMRELRDHLLAFEGGTLRDCHDAAFAFLARRYGKQSWIERSGGSLAYIDALRGAWGNARYIHIYRDGPSCARSMSKHPYFRVRVARALARTPMPIRACLEATIPVEQYGAYWSAVILRGLRALREVPREDVLHVRYEELVTEPVPVLRRVQRFLEGGVHAEEWILQAIECIRIPAHCRAVPAGETRLTRACRAGMTELANAEAG